jgi:hypothetical protein
MDRLADGVLPVPPETIDHTPILGAWTNTNPRTWGISHVDLAARDGRVWMRVRTADPGAGPHDWGETAVDRIYTDGPFSSHVVGYVATFVLGHARIDVQANMNHGLTVVAAFTTFTDGSGRSNYFSREFFHRRGEPR